MRRCALGRLVAALLLALLSAPAFAGAASAHAALVGSDPADGAVLAEAPAVVALRFNEPAAPLALTLVRPDGSVSPLPNHRLLDRTLEVALPEDLEPGTHVLSWRVVSEDGHPVGGALVFSLGAPGGNAALAVEAGDGARTLAIWTLRTLIYVGLFLGVGGVFFALWIGRPPADALRLARAAILLGAMALALSVGLQGLDALGWPLGELGRVTAWRAGAATTYGRTALLAGVALAAGLVAPSAGATLGAGLALLALLAAGAALAASGHAGAAAPQWLARPAVFVHAVGIAFWAGALLPLAAALRSGGSEAARLLRRFSRTIPFALLPLLGAGFLLAWLQLGRVEALWRTEYGQVLLTKLALVLALLVLAAVNRFRLTRGMERGDRDAARRLHRSVVTELLLVLAILAVAAAWRFTPPPRSLPAPTPIAVHLHAAKAMADVTIEPGAAGPTRVTILPLAPDMGPLTAQEVTLVLANPAAGIEPIRRAAQPLGDGTWQVELVVPQPGTWSLRLELLISDFERARLRGEIEIRP